MNKFKVGDIIFSIDKPSRFFIHEIIDGYYLVKCITRKESQFGYEFIIPFTDEKHYFNSCANFLSLYNFDIVTTRDNTRYIVIGDLLINDNESIHLSLYNADGLKLLNDQKDIVKVSVPVTPINTLGDIKPYQLYNMIWFRKN